MPPEDSRSAENSTGVLEAVSQLEMYKLARAQVEHENTLVGQRITWFLTFQGLMLTAFFVAIGLLGKERTQFSELARANISVAVLLLAAIGFMSCIACFLLVRAAYAQINVVEEWWRAHSIPKSAFPDITGTGGFSLLGHHVTGADFVLVLAFSWCLLAYLFYCSASQSVGPKQ